MSKALDKHSAINLQLSMGEWKKHNLLFTHPHVLLHSLYCSPDAFCLFTPTPWPNLAWMREIKSGLVKSLHFPALVSSIKLSLLAGHLRDAANTNVACKEWCRKPEDTTEIAGCSGWRGVVSMGLMRNHLLKHLVRWITVAFLTLQQRGCAGI